MIVFEESQKRNDFATYLGRERSRSFAFVNDAEPSVFPAVK